MTKASDNEFPKVILDVGTIPAAPTDGTWKLYAASGGVYAVSSNATAGPFGAAAGGSVGDGKDYIHTPPGSADATDDEFNDGTGMSGPVNGLDVKWSKHNLGTAGWTILSDSVAPGCVLFDIPTGQAADQYIYQTIPSGDWTYAARWHPHYMEARAMFGLIAVSSAGTGVSCCIDQNGTWGIRTITTWADGGGGTFGPANNYSADYQSASGVRAPLNITLRKASGVYYAGWSFSDRLKPGNYHEISHTPAAFTPAYIGFGRIYGGVGTTYLLDFFRKVA